MTMRKPFGMKLARPFRSSLVLALAIGAAACDNTTGPSSLSELDAQAALADYAAMDRILASDGWQSYRMTASQLDVQRFGSAPAAAAATELLTDVRGAAAANSRAFAAAMSEAADRVAAGASARLPLISDYHRGRTFIFDGERNDWVVDPDRTGAPANGVRFILYAPKGARPDPTREIGYADLIDEGDNTGGIALRLIVVEGELTIVDYALTVEGENGMGHVTVSGFVRDHEDTLEFDIDVHGEKQAGAESGDITFDLAIDSREFVVQGDVHGEKDHGDEHGSVDLLVRHGDRSFRVDVTSDNHALAGTIDLNGSLFANVSGTSANPIFETPEGDPITGGNALVLLRMYDIAEDVFDLFEDLVEPVAELIILAIIL